MSDCLFDDCGGCSCHLSPPCGHCIDHSCEHIDTGMCEACFEIADMSPEEIEKENKALQIKTVSILKRLGKLIPLAERIAFNLDAAEGTLPHLRGSDRVRKQMNSHFKVLMRKINNEKEVLKQITDRQQALKGAE